MTHLWITGGTGFLGSCLIRRLVAEPDNEITVLKKRTSSLARLDGIRDRIRLLDWGSKNIAGRMAIDRPDIVVHCATNYGRNAEPRCDIVEANLLLPLELLDASLACGIKAFVNTDTFLDKRVSAYSLSKKHFRDWLLASSGEIQSINVILEHFYGAADDPSKFVSFVVRDLLAGIPRLELTSGEQKRDFVYIDDVVEAFTTILRSISGGSVGFREFEIGSGTTTSVRSVVELARDLAGNTSTSLDFGALPYRANEVMDVNVDTTRIRALGWQPKFTLAEGLREMVRLERARE